MVPNSAMLLGSGTGETVTAFATRTFELSPEAVMLRIGFPLLQSTARDVNPDELPIAVKQLVVPGVPTADVSQTMATSSSAVPVNPRPVSSAPSLLTNRLFVVEVFK